MRTIRDRNFRILKLLVSAISAIRYSCRLLQGFPDRYETVVAMKVAVERIGRLATALDRVVLADDSTEWGIWEDGVKNLRCFDGRNYHGLQDSSELSEFIGPFCR